MSWIPYCPFCSAALADVKLASWSISPKFLGLAVSGLMMSGITQLTWQVGKQDSSFPPLEMPAFSARLACSKFCLYQTETLDMTLS